MTDITFGIKNYANNKKSVFMHSFTFLLPVRIDNSDRFENLNTSLRYLTSNYPDAEILLIEDDSEKKCEELQNKYSTRYFFRKNDSSFSRSSNINFGLLKSTRPFFAVWDVDCLVLPNQMKTTYDILSKGHIHIVLPHNEIFVNIKGSLKERVSSSLNLFEVPQFKKVPKVLNHHEMEVYPIPSGVVVFNKDALLRIGGFNKKMISYGWEDIEVLKRAEKLGLYYFSLSRGNIIHLDHQRGKDSSVNPQYEKNKAEFHKVLAMSKKTLINYINNELSLNDTGIDKEFLSSIKKHNLQSFAIIRYYINRIKTKLNTHPPRIK